MTLSRLVLATRNAHKLDELRRILAEANLDIELVGIDQCADVPEVAETGTTFAENALLKARATAQATGVASIADDSGLCVTVLGGMPGVFSARWSGQHGADRANVELVLAQIADVPDELRSAHFSCAVALVFPDGTEQVTEGVMTGTLLRAARGSGGFGYDPIFQPDGEMRTTAELSPVEKDALSHRGRALRAMVALIRAVDA